MRYEPMKVSPGMMRPLLLVREPGASMGLKGAVLGLCIGVAPLLSGCAMQQDMRVLNDRINGINIRSNQVQKDLITLQEQLDNTRQDLKSIDTVKTVEALGKSLDVVGKKQAEMGLRIDEIRGEVMRLQGSGEEIDHQLQELKTQNDAQFDHIGRQANRLQESAAKAEEEDKTLTEKVDRISEQMTGLESKVSDLEKRLLRQEEMPPRKTESIGETKPEETQETRKPAPRKSPKEAYEDAYEQFKNNDFAAAREKLKAFLKENPDSELAGNARYWLAETYYQQGRYEEAILEYEKVLTARKGPKVPAAMLKQGLAFHQLGDAKTARYLLEKLVKDYPKTEQADIARVNLKKWGK